MRKLLRKIMAIFINGIEYLTAFINGKECEGWLQGKKLWPTNEISITRIQFLLESLPEGYIGSTQLEHIPACGAATAAAILTYQYDDALGEHHTGEVEVTFKDGSISALSRYYSEQGKSLIGIRHADFEIDDVEFSDFAINIYQEANVVTLTDRSEPSEILKADDWYYNTPVVESFSYSGDGLLACGGDATPQFLVSATKIKRRYIKTEKTWKDLQSTAMEEVGADPERVGIEGGNEEWVNVSAPVTTEYREPVTGEVFIRFEFSDLISAASVVSNDTGVISVDSMRTTSYPDGRTIGKAKIMVIVSPVKEGEESLVKESVTLFQEPNTSTISSSEYTGIKSAEFIDANGNKITDVLSYEAQIIFIRTQAIKTVSYTWTSGAESTGTEYEYKRADSYSLSNESLFTVQSSWNSYFKAVPVSVSKNTDKNNRRGGYIIAYINGKSATTQSITQEVNMEQESPSSDTYLTPEPHQTGVTADGKPVYVWDLKRTDKPLYTSTVVNYSFIKGGPNITTTTITGSVTVAPTVAEGDVVKSNIAGGIMVSVVNYKETV